VAKASDCLVVHGVAWIVVVIADVPFALHIRKQIESLAWQIELQGVKRAYTIRNWITPKIVKAGYSSLQRPGCDWLIIQPQLVARAIAKLQRNQKCILAWNRFRQPVIFCITPNFGDRDLCLPQGSRCKCRRGFEVKDISSRGPYKPRLLIAFLSHVGSAAYGASAFTGAL
jgi:hypothetical protein